MPEQYKCDELDKFVNEAKTTQTTKQLPEIIIKNLLFDNKGKIKLYDNHNILEILANKMLNATDDNDIKIYQTAYEGILAHYDNHLINDYLRIGGRNGSDNAFTTLSQLKKDVDDKTSQTTEATNVESSGGVFTSYSNITNILKKEKIEKKKLKDVFPNLYSDFREEVTKLTTEAMEAIKKNPLNESAILSKLREDLKSKALKMIDTISDQESRGKISTDFNTGIDNLSDEALKYDMQRINEIEKYSKFIGKRGGIIAVGTKDAIYDASLGISALASHAMEFSLFAAAYYSQGIRIASSLTAELFGQIRHGAGPLVDNKTKSNIESHIFPTSSKVNEATDIKNGIDMSANEMFEQALINNATKNISPIDTTKLKPLIQINDFSSTSISSNTDQFKEMQKHFFPHNEYLDSVYVLKNTILNKETPPLVFAIDRDNQVIIPDSTLLTLQQFYSDKEFDIKYNGNNISWKGGKCDTSYKSLEDMNDSPTLNQRLTDLVTYSQSSNANYTNITAILKDMPVPGSDKKFREAFPDMYDAFKTNITSILSNKDYTKDILTIRTQITSATEGFFNSESNKQKFNQVSVDTNKIKNGFLSKLAILPDQMIEDDKKKISDIEWYNQNLYGCGKNVLAAKRVTGKALAMIAAIPELSLHFTAFMAGKIEHGSYLASSYIERTFSSALRNNIGEAYKKQFGRPKRDTSAGPKV